MAGMQEALGDSQLVARAAAGDQDSFAALYNRYFDRVYDFAHRLMRNSEEAADITQDTFVKAAEALRGLKRQESFKAWLFSITHNLAMNRLERMNRTPRPIESEEDEEPLIYQQIDPDRLANPETAAEDSDLARLVWEAAAGLDPRQYALLDLHVRQGLDSAEIAEVLGVSKGNGYVMLNRLKKAVEEAMTAYIMACRGRRECTALNELLTAAQFEAMTPDIRRAVDRHIASCPTCGESRKRLVSPLAILGALAPVVPPAGLRESIFQAVATPGPPPGQTGGPSQASTGAGKEAVAGTGSPPTGVPTAPMIAPPTGHGLGWNLVGELAGRVPFLGLAGVAVGLSLAVAVFLAIDGRVTAGDPRDPDDVLSTSHEIDRPSTDNVINIAWSSPPGARAFSVLWSGHPNDLPDTEAELPGDATGATSPALAEGAWHFHLRTQGKSGRWTSTVHLGPFLIAPPILAPLATATAAPLIQTPSAATPKATSTSAPATPFAAASAVPSAAPSTATAAPASTPEPVEAPRSEETPGASPTRPQPPTATVTAAATEDVRPEGDAPAPPEQVLDTPSPTPEGATFISTPTATRQATWTYTPVPPATGTPTPVPTVTSSATPTPAPILTATPTATPKPVAKADLVILSFSGTGVGTCKPGSAVYAFKVTVGNHGTAPSPGVLVQVMDEHGNGWGNGVQIGPIPPGESRAATVSVYYFANDPKHMTAAAPHPFRATVDPSHQIDETNDTNNTSAAFNMNAPPGCANLN